MKKVLLIIPAYNEEDNILSVVSEIRQKCPDYDFVVINDGSTDNTEKVLQSAAIPHICLPFNTGIGACIQTGYIYAYRNGYECAVQIDGDGQHDCRYIDSLVAPIFNNEADFVIGSRYIQNEGFQSSTMRRLGIKWLSTVIYLCSGTKIKDVTSGFRAANRAVIELFVNNYADDYPEPEAIITACRNNKRVKEVPVIMRAREMGTSSITGIKSIYYMVKVTLSILVGALIAKGAKT